MTNPLWGAAEGGNPQQPSKPLRVGAGVLAAAIFVYTAAYSFAVAPKAFLGKHDPAAAAAGAHLETAMLPLELPKDETALKVTLRLIENPAHENVTKTVRPFKDAELGHAQRALYQRSLDWDYVFIFIYVLQYASAILLIHPTVRNRGIPPLAWETGAGLVIELTGVFNVLENLSIQNILDQAKAPDAAHLSFAKLCEAVTRVSTVKWALFSIGCILLSVLIAQSQTFPAKAFLIATLATAGIIGLAGCVPGSHGWLPIPMLLYGLLPLVLAWRLICYPLIRRGDDSAKRVALRAHEFAFNHEAHADFAQIPPFDLEQYYPAPKRTRKNT